MFYLYQQRGDGEPRLVSCHKSSDEAKQAGNAQLALWHEAGVHPPTLFACYNGSRSVEVWRDGKDAPTLVAKDELPIHLTALLFQMVRTPDHGTRVERVR